MDWGELAGPCCCWVFLSHRACFPGCLAGEKRGLRRSFQRAGGATRARCWRTAGLPGCSCCCTCSSQASVWPWVGFAGALAAANADTWATELGVLSRSAPRSIRNGQKVEPGTSGGVSLLGMAAAAGGALLIALLAVVCWMGQILAVPGNWQVWLAGITLAGLAGSSADSLLGATIQAIYWCPACEKETERHPLHTCGTATTLMRGWAWLDNDWVNTACTAVGAGAAVLVALGM